MSILHGTKGAVGMRHRRGLGGRGVDKWQQGYKMGMEACKNVQVRSGIKVVYLLNRARVQASPETSASLANFISSSHWSVLAKNSTSTTLPFAACTFVHRINFNYLNYAPFGSNSLYLMSAKIDISCQRYCASQPAESWWRAGFSRPSCSHIDYLVLGHH